VLAVARDFLACRKELVGRLDGQSLRFDLDLSNRCFKAVGLLASSNLRELNLNDTPVLNLTPLSTLVNLESPNLENTPVENLTPLSNLVNLTELRLTSFSSLGLTRRQDILDWVKYAVQPDRSPLAHLVNLRIYP
jgi:hypothetical protein